MKGVPQRVTNAGQRVRKHFSTAVQLRPGSAVVRAAAGLRRRRLSVRAI